VFLSVSAGDRSTHVGTLDSDERRAIPGVPSEAKYSTTGHLLFIQNNALVAQSFDTDRLTLSGDPFQIAEQVSGGPLAAHSVSRNGDVAYSPASALLAGVVTSFDRGGTAGAAVGPAAEYRSPALSPGGRFLAFERGVPGDIWVMDLESGVSSPFTTHASGDFSPVWSPNQQAIVFASDRDGARSLYERPFGARGDERLILKVDENATTAMDWSSDGRYVLYGAALDLWALPRFGDQQPFRVTEGPAAELQARLSPDGRWMAYTSNESGAFEVFVQSFPQPELRRQVSTSGGFTPRWSPDGGELYYVTPTGMLMAVPVTLGSASFDVRTPTALFRSTLASLLSVDPRIRGAYDVAPDGRFLMAVGPDSPPMSVILNWSPGPGR
jgi:hypothetical protein